MCPGTIFYRDTATQQNHQVHHTEQGSTGSRYQQAARYWEQGEGYCRKQRCLKVYPGERQTAEKPKTVCDFLRQNFPYNQKDDFKYPEWELWLPGRMLLPHLAVEKRVTALSVQHLFLHVSNHLEIELLVALSLTFIFSLIMSQQNLIS